MQIQMNIDIIINKITEEYNSEILTTQNKDELDINYRYTIKYLHALFDSYNITLYQLLLYNTDLLRIKLNEFPNLNAFNYTLSTQITLIPTYINSYKPIHIKLAVNLYDIFPDIIAPQYDYVAGKFIPGLTQIYSIDLFLSDFGNIVKVKDKIIHNMKWYIISERDILILCKPSLYIKHYTIVFIEISSGNIIYKKISSIYQHFTYCNDTIISIALKSNIHITTYNITYNISEALSILHLDKDSNIRYTDLFPNCFYGDSRGLYIAYGNRIIFIDSLHNIINCKQNPYKQLNLKLHMCSEIIQLININYSNEILLRIKNNLTLCDTGHIYKVILNVIDFEKLMY